MSYAVGNSSYNNHRGSMFENASYFKIENTTLNNWQRRRLHNASGRDINNYYKSPHDEDKNIQQWLAAPDCSVNLFTAFDKIVDGTSQWIFEDETYLKWKETGAGSGKTVLITSIIKNLEKVNDTSLVAYHYFDLRNNAGVQTTYRGLLLSLLSQLGTQDHQIHSALQSLHESSKHGLSYAKPTTAEVIDTLIKIIEDLIQKGHSIHIMIDALDECGDMPLVLEFLTKIYTFSFLKIICSSRNYHPANLQCFAISLSDNSMIHKDIGVFVDSQITELFKGISLGAEVKQTLMEKADGGDAQMLPNGLEKIISTTLVTIHNKEVIQLAHASVKEFLLERNISTEQVDYEYLWRGVNMISRKNMITTLGQYATQYWAEHSRNNEIADIPCKYTLELTWEFFNSKPFQNWKWSYLYMGNGPVKTEVLGSPLQAAAAMGQRGIAELLLKLNADVNIQGGDYGTALQAAATWGHTDIIELLLKHDADVNIQGGLYGTALQAAAFSGHNDIIELLLEYNADVNILAGFTGTALQAAAARGHKDTVELLLQSNANVNIPGGDYGTALQAAAAWGHKDIIALLLEHDADVNIQAGGSGTALQAAAVGGHKDIIELLLKHNVNINFQSEEIEEEEEKFLYDIIRPMVEICNMSIEQAIARYEAQQLLAEEEKAAFLRDHPGVSIESGLYGTALQGAAYSGHKDIVEIFLKHNANVNIQSGIYGTALQAAAFGGHKEIIELLLNYGAEVNSQTGQFGTALQAAAYSGHSDIIELLLKYNADVNIQAGQYGSALQAAAFNGQNEIIKLLLKHNADIDSQGGSYGTALQAAAVRGHKDSIKLLLKCDAAVNIQSGYYGTALQAAAAKGHKDSLELLLDFEADVNIQGGVYGTALHAAAAQGQMNITEILLRLNADVNIEGGFHGTALQAAAACGYKNIVELLLKHNADANIQAGIDGTALQAAASCGHNDIIELLLKHNANVNIQVEYGGTALQAAAARGHKDTVELLLKYNALDVYIESGIYGTALEAAVAEGHKDTVEVLLKHNALEFGNLYQK
ncbi:ankyrin repeat-containing domain protein [Lentinula raphanica]|uniref:Ankyrin repeat-containing domain protein n=1 Tax=Lentinula raphanica TaxID=153919 RepID=A0AA38PIM8_9AGAR|nr:ankyrin repeat-containing domain protein [Lentinula raphanica]